MIVADDFGLHPSINRGITGLLEERKIHAASLLVNGPAVDDAIALMRDHPEWKVGLHLNLTEGKPLLPAHQVQTLVTDAGFFKWSIMGLFCGIVSGLVSIQQVHIEFQAQLAYFLQCRERCAMINGHQHIHLFPRIAACVLAMAKASDVAYVRFPYEKMCLPNTRFCRSVQNLFLKGLCLSARRHFRQYGFSVQNGFYGFCDASHLTSDALTAFVQQQSGASYEVMCHPGEEIGADSYRGFSLRHYNGAQELEILHQASLLSAQ